MSDLKTKFKELSVIFNSLCKGVIDQIPSNFFKHSSFPEENQNLDRYKNRKSIRSRTLSLINRQFLVSMILWKIKDIPVVKEIYEILIKEEHIYFKYIDYESDCNSRPSIPFNIIASFLSELIIENESGMYYDQSKFEEIYTVLDEFLSSEEISYTLLVGIYGPYGKVGIEINDNISIKRTSYEVAKLFTIHYPQPMLFDMEMFENDYYIEIKRTTSRTKLNDSNKADIETIETIFNSLILSNPGNIEIGKKIKISKFWMLIKTEQLDYSGRINKYNDNNKFLYDFDTIDIENFQNTYHRLKNVNFESLESKIKKSFIRFKKYKSLTDIEDKIIELILSIEYLINTTNYEVTLQLTLKLISFARESITNKTETYKEIKKFLALRADVIHGKKDVDYATKNLNLLKNIEVLQSKILLKFIIQSQTYKFDKINDAIEKSLHNYQTVETILKNDCG